MPQFNAPKSTVSSPGQVTQQAPRVVDTSHIASMHNTRPTPTLAITGHGTTRESTTAAISPEAATAPPDTLEHLPAGMATPRTHATQAFSNQPPLLDNSPDLIRLQRVQHAREGNAIFREFLQQQQCDYQQSQRAFAIARHPNEASSSSNALPTTQAIGSRNTPHEQPQRATHHPNDASSSSNAVRSPSSQAGQNRHLGR